LAALSDADKFYFQFNYRSEEVGRITQGAAISMQGRSETRMKDNAEADYFLKQVFTLG